MNKQQKIIVSIVGITIVLLALLGITYAYYLTRIEGNTNTNSISITTAKLELVYGDNSAEIITGSGTLLPNSNNPIGTKTFTVTNNGNDSSYVVIIDNVSVTKASDGTNTDFISNDFRYTLSCTVKDKSGNELSGEKCNNVANQDIFPIKGGILVSNNIKENKVHEYTLTLWYIDTGIDQSDDMGKSYQARVNITDVNQMGNPFSTGVSEVDNKILAYNIIENAKNERNGTKLKSHPDTQPIYEIPYYKNLAEINYYVPEGIEGLPVGWMYGNSSSYNSGTTYLECIDDMVGKYVTDRQSLKTYGPVYDCSDSNKPVVLTYGNLSESSLTTIQDDYGISYYYRGTIEDNYVNFAGMCWRIVRILGDGSIKLVLEDKNTICNDDIDNDGNGTSDYKYTGDWSIASGNFGYDSNYFPNYLKPTQDAQNSMIKYFYDFQTNGKLKDYVSKLKSGDWCYYDTPYEQINGSYVLLNDETLNSIKSKLVYGTVYFSSNVQLYNDIYSASLKCNGTKLDSFINNSVDSEVITEESPMYVGGLSILEIIYAGFINEQVDYVNRDSYLINDEFKKGSSGLISKEDFYTMSPSVFYYNSYSTDFRSGILYNDGSLISKRLSSEAAIRPSIILASGSKIDSGGDGTIDNPYVIE